MKHLMTGAIIATLCAFCFSAQTTAMSHDDQVEPRPTLDFEVKVLNWRPGKNEADCPHGLSTIEILGPEQWRGQTLDVRVDEFPGAWKTKGQVFTIRDSAWNMAGYLEEKRESGGEMNRPLYSGRIELAHPPEGEKPAPPVEFEIKITNWKPCVLPTLGTRNGLSSIEILNPPQWRGETLGIYISTFRDIWNKPGNVFTIVDRTGGMIEYLEDKRDGVNTLHLLGSGVFELKNAPEFEVKVTKWTPKYKEVADSAGDSTVEILNPQKWRGQTANVWAGQSTGTDPWKTTGRIFTIVDRNGQVTENLLEKQTGGDTQPAFATMITLKKPEPGPSP